MLNTDMVNAFHFSIHYAPCSLPTVTQAFALLDPGHQHIFHNTKNIIILRTNPLSPILYGFRAFRTDIHNTSTKSILTRSSSIP